MYDTNLAGAGGGSRSRAGPPLSYGDSVTQARLRGTVGRGPSGGAPLPAGPGRKHWVRTSSGRGLESDRAWAQCETQSQAQGEDLKVTEPECETQAEIDNISKVGSAYIGRICRI